MYKIGIIGSENSHAMAFARIFNGFDPNCETKYDDVRVVAVGGHYPEASQKVFDACGLDFIAEKPEDMLGKVDAVMVTARNGAFHPEFVRPFIEAGIPAFVDKPFANCGEEALALARLAKAKNVPLVGGSSVKLVYDVQLLRHALRTQFADGICGGNVVAPVNMENEWGGFYFYASHLAEISMTVFGYDPKSVMAWQNPNGVSAMVRYEDFSVSNHFAEGNYSYSAAIYGKGKTVARDIDLSMCYQHECQIFMDMLRSGKMAHSYEHLVWPVFYLNAIKKSYESGVEQAILRPEV